MDSEAVEHQDAGVSLQPKLTIQDIPQEKWDALSRKRIFFGHQSVGYNIITGVEELLKKYPNIRLHIVRKSDSPFNGPAFAHDWIGSNMNPESKINAFSGIMHRFSGNVDIAFMKFCYVDITAATNIHKIFQEYKDLITEMQGRYPDTRFVVVTVPLTTKPKGVAAIQQAAKYFIKKVLAKPAFDYRDNINRHIFNQMLREEYTGRVPIFDLASLESRGRDGKPSFFLHNGRQVPTLANEFTSDGGHLNREASRMIAEQLLVFLAELE